MGSQRVRHGWATLLSLFTFMHWRRKWQPLQCSCLENPGDGGAWWAAVYGVAQSRTRLKRHSSSSSSIHTYTWVNTFGFYKLHSLAYFCFSSRGRHMHSKYLYPHIYMSYFKSWKMMSWKCCTQYASKFGKFSSGHRTGKGQFSFQSQGKAMSKNAQTTTQLHSSHMLVK